MSEDKNQQRPNDREAPEIKALRQELAEMKQVVNQLLADKAVPSQPLTANIVLPDTRKEEEARYRVATETADAVEAKAMAALQDGPRMFRVCTLDDVCMRKLEFQTQRMKRRPQPWEFDFYPENPWRVVGAPDQDVAIAKYTRFMGIRAHIEGDFIVYEVDGNGQPVNQNGQQLAQAA